MQRAGKGTCASTNATKAAPRFAPGDRAQCWRARAPGTVGRPYTCPTPECVRIDDPAEEAEGAVTGAIAACVIGVLCLVGACACAAVGYGALKATGGVRGDPLRM